MTAIRQYLRGLPVFAGDLRGPVAAERSAADFLARPAGSRAEASIIHL